MAAIDPPGSAHPGSCPHIRGLKGVVGVLCGSVPFLFPVHGDRYDVWRYTDSGLRSLLDDVGFRDIEVRPHGNRHTAAWILLSGGSRAARVLNPVVRRCFRRDNPSSPGGYVFTVVAFDGPAPPGSDGREERTRCHAVRELGAARSDRQKAFLASDR